MPIPNPELQQAVLWRWQDIFDTDAPLPRNAALSKFEGELDRIIGEALAGDADMTSVAYVLQDFASGVYKSVPGIVDY